MERIDAGTNELVVTVDDKGVGSIMLNRPESRNALTMGQMKRLGDVLATMEERKDVRCILLTGAGNTFCAGADVTVLTKGVAPKKESASTKPARTADGQKELQRNVVNRIWNMPTPVIASLPGAAVGAGFGLALACDFRIAADSATIHSGFARIAASGDMNISFFLTHLVGPSKAMEFMYSSNTLTGQQACDFGLVNQVVPAAELDKAALAMARELAAGPSLAMGMIKRHIHLALAGDADACLDREIDDIDIALKSADHKEGVRALIEKRPPNFTGT